MGRNETVVTNRRVVADVIAAPQDAVVADFHERLDRIVFENETVLAKLHVAPNEGATADITCRTVSLGLGGFVKPGTKAIELVIDQRCVELDLVRIELIFESLKGNNR